MKWKSEGRRSKVESRNLLGRMGLLTALVFAGAWGMSWVETSQPDFGDGAPDGNIYASYRDSGAVEFLPRFDLNNDGYMDLVCPDDSGPYLRVYFGSATGYDSADSRYFPMAGGGGVDIADLNTDGFAELIHSGWHARNVVIYWGSDSGPSPTDTTRLGTGGQSEAVTVHDLDRDSYLDIIAATDSGDVCVFWGSAGGYSTSNSAVVTLGGRIGHDLGVADFDKDGWTDIVAVRWNRDSNAVVYWGPGRHPREYAWLPMPDGKPHGTTVADFNRDGWLDICGNAYDDGLSAYIYYGSDSGFSVARREVVHPGQCYGGSAAAYWNADSSLDLVFFRGDFDTTVSMVPQVFFNDPGSTPHFSDANRADIGTRGFNASGGLVADFNQDSAADVFVDGYNEGEPSYVLWGPAWTDLDSLPADKSHHGLAREVGNVYDRRFREGYTSSICYAGDTVVWRRVAWQDTTPGGSAVELELRFGNTPEPGPEWTEWQPYGNGDTIPSYLASSRIQYRTTFRYENPALLPMLYSVQVDYDSLPFFDVGPVTIVAPIGNIDSGTVVVPRAVVRNFGNQPATFPVTMLIGASYADSVSESLAVGGEDTVRFAEWIAAPVGVMSATCVTALAGDENHHNDTITAAVQVLRPPKPDVGATAILAPPDSVDSGTVVTPRAVVKNFGPLAAEFPVVMSIGTAYADTMTDSLGVGESDTLTFANWAALVRGDQPIVCYTDLVVDGDRSNDTAYGSAFVGPPAIHDVGVEEILAPIQPARAGDTLRPKALVRNFGTRVERYFDVRFRIGAAYSRTVNVSAALAPDSTVVVAFPDWVAVAGNYVVSCSTMLGFDLDRTNDKETLSLAVSRYLELLVEPDQSDTVASDTQQSYRFYAKLGSDSAKVIDLALSEVPPGWAAEFYDTTGNALGNQLGLLGPGETGWFCLSVTTPDRELAGVLDTLSVQFTVTGKVRSDTTVRDSALLTLTLAPLLTVHNYPNPCFGSTRFIIGLPEPGKVTLTLYDRAGARVKLLRDGEEVSPGVLLVDWNGTNDAGKPVASGSYRYCLDYSRNGTNTTIVKKLALVRR